MKFFKKITTLLSIVFLFILQSNISAETLNINRIYGENRYLTAINISKNIKEKNTVILANSKNFIDALPGTVLANANNGVILLSKVDNIDKDTLNEINSISPDKIIILGGENSISTNIENELKSIGHNNIQRIGGENRFETSILIADEIEKISKVDTYIITSNPADSVTATSLAKNDKPIILIDNKNISEKLKNTLKEKIVLGGKNSISEENYDILGATKRINGSDRYETSLKIAIETNSKSSIITNGKTLIDALTAGTLAYQNQSSILLTNEKTLNANIKKYLDTQDNVTIIGGEKSVPNRLFDKNIDFDNIKDNKSKNTDNQSNNQTKPLDKNSFEYWNYYNKYTNNLIYTKEDIENINKNNINKSQYLYNILDVNTNQFGVIAKRTIIKNQPMGKNYTDPNTFDDYSSQSGLFPWDEVAIKKYNSDKSWANIVSVDYEGWIPTKDIMKVSKNQILNIRDEEFVTVTSRQIKDNNGYLIDMGTRLPLVKINNHSFITKMPIAGENYNTRNIEINKNDAIQGYLPFTQTNVIKQMLKFNGEKYGWGHSNGTRDCSGFVRDVYRSFGILLPRDTSTQSKDAIGKNINFNISGGHNAKNELLKKQNPGFAAMYMPGHMMLYLGIDEKGQTYMVHQYGYRNINGKNIGIFKNEISPTNILGNNDKTFLYNTYLIKDLSILN